jgi:uncharacterized protein (TIGR02217 family)
MNTSFIETRFPTAISRGSQGGPDWLAEIVERASGHEERNSPWSMPIHYYDVKYGVRTQDELHDIKSIYLVAGGRLRGFRYKDWADYKSCAPLTNLSPLDQVIGTGTGALATFQLQKTYEFAGETFVRLIAKPVAGTVRVAVDGTEKTLTTHFTVNTTTGIVTFTLGNIPALDAEVTAGFEFDVPARFDGRLDQAVLNGPLGDIPSIPLKELRL